MKPVEILEVISKTPVMKILLLIKTLTSASDIADIIDSNYPSTTRYLKKLEQMRLVISIDGKASDSNRKEKMYVSALNDIRMKVDPTNNCLELYISTHFEIYHNNTKWRLND